MLVEDRIYGALVYHTCILQAKGHQDVALHSPWCSEGCMLLVSWIHFDLILSREAIHQGHPLETACIVNYDIRDREKKFIFGTSDIQIAEVNTNLKLPVLLGDENNVGNPIRMLLLLD